ncbi:hypothetical protein [Photobacterium lutimaris]|uniref:Uncharacterized protein n=1 Tax=Photobacterium lutimaris TaxID=388278 RepID=A0A2T3ITL5_9GAMM|nr:hypothetical protein [Photobacterium lutimaris]PSU31706.1 hypothetical protein C9I99_21195 [Photobacterium lutimaris]TDR72654.1 hypothetical protein DFP78_113130 [Photobacterium lutimaris]
MEKKSYRDILMEYFGGDIASIVGCGLDRAGGHYTCDVQNKAIALYEKNIDEFNRLPIGARRQIIADFVTSGIKPDGYV